MFRAILKQRSLLVDQRARYIKGYWPEPITQSTLDEFLKDINYFEHKQNYLDIGMKIDEKPSKPKPTSETSDEPNELDNIIQSLAQDIKLPSLDKVDVKVNEKLLTRLAIRDGIFRDLFTNYQPPIEHIKFTEKQAKDLDRLVPYFWITDQPFARVDPKDKDGLDRVKQLPTFRPLIGVSAKFVYEPKSVESEGELHAHTSFHGNIVPACDAKLKPAITLDGSLLNQSDDQQAQIEENWVPGSINMVNFDPNDKNLYSLLMLNLDHMHSHNANLHWMVTNICKSPEGQVQFDQVHDYLPVHGIRGFGYSRYAFLLLQHTAKYEFSVDPEDFSLDARRFNAMSFLDKNRALNMTPIGLSWFQTLWDSSSNSIFHDYIKIRAPVFDFVQPAAEKRHNSPYPGKVPFNIFMDHTREKKELNERVLLDRLKKLDPTTSYEDQYVPPKVPPTVFQDEIGQPDWMKNVIFKKVNKIGYWRGLRPASALLPLNNNEDLDYPIRPIVSSSKNPPGEPNQYDGRVRYKRLKDIPTGRPPEEHESVLVQDNDKSYIDAARKMMEEFKPAGKSKEKRASD